MPGAQGVGDEGAANHTRFAQEHARRGLHFFVFGHRALEAKRSAQAPQSFPSRRGREASVAVARQHLLPDDQLIFAQQNPAAIDAGVFHNDVISVGHENVLLYHEQAFVDTPR